MDFRKSPNFLRLNLTFLCLSGIVFSHMILSSIRPEAGYSINGRDRIQKCNSVSCLSTWYCIVSLSPLLPGLAQYNGYRVFQHGELHHGGHGNPLQYSCLENPMDRGAWQATAHRVTKIWIQLKWLHTYTCENDDTTHFSVMWRRLSPCAGCTNNKLEVIHWRDVWLAVHAFGWACDEWSAVSMDGRLLMTAHDMGLLWLKGLCHDGYFRTDAAHWISLPGFTFLPISSMNSPLTPRCLLWHPFSVHLGIQFLKKIFF